MAELLAVGWWSEEDGAYVIRHHGQYQRTKADVLRQQEANQRNGARGGRPRKPPREQAPDLTGNPVAYPVASQKGQDRPGEGRATTDGRKHARVSQPLSARPGRPLAARGPASADPLPRMRLAS